MTLIQISSSWWIIYPHYKNSIIMICIIITTWQHDNLKRMWLGMQCSSMNSQRQSIRLCSLATQLWFCVGPSWYTEPACRPEVHARVLVPVVEVSAKKSWYASTSILDHFFLWNLSYEALKNLAHNTFNLKRCFGTTKHYCYYCYHSYNINWIIGNNNKK